MNSAESEWVKVKPKRLSDSVLDDIRLPCVFGMLKGADPDKIESLLLALPTSIDAVKVDEDYFFIVKCVLLPSDKVCADFAFAIFDMLPQKKIVLFSDGMKGGDFSEVRVTKNYPNGVQVDRKELYERHNIMRLEGAIEHFGKTKRELCAELKAANETYYGHVVAHRGKND